MVIAVPRNGGHVVLDMAMSQYAYGKLQQYQSEEAQLPLPGGYDTEGQLTTDPEAIINSKRILPAGFGKGSGLALVLDLLVTILSQGNSTQKITGSGHETGVSQVFICIKPVDEGQNEALIESSINYAKSSRAEPDKQVQYPGEGVLKTRAENLRLGVPVDEKIWSAVLDMRG